MPAIILVGGTVYGTAWWLVTHLGNLPPADTATARSEAIRTALAAGAGLGAAFTLILAFRRQRHQEINTLINEHDGTERRVTELYTKAVEQLGSDHAAVRLGGLYALERVAQNNPAHRQTIVDVICAYLRMPYTPPQELTREARQETIRTAQRNYRSATRRSSVSQRLPTNGTANGRNPHEEKQVRLTAQRILADHLRNEHVPSPRRRRRRAASNSRFWEGMRLDLAGATLIDFDLAMCTTAGASFHGATFSGGARFDGATFGDVRFSEATFSKDAHFDGASFGNAGFLEATFSGDARFGSATFGDAWFSEATFSEDALFDSATFGDAWFSEATFSKDAHFGDATFRNARFLEATFSGDAQFDRATFGAVWFSKATFSRTVWFSEATFSKTVWFSEAIFSGDAQFSDATFSEVTQVSDATFSESAGFEPIFRGGAIVDGALVLNPEGNHVWPPEWEVTVQLDGTGVVTRAMPEPDAHEPL
jgi:uncharacterized protein YjbI with pentapeptide repeats